jgi:hypothetical protein
MKVDFSQFHPLDHPIWRCSGYPGGPRRHVELWWLFMGREWVNVKWKHATRRHEWQPYARRDRVDREWIYSVVCAGCTAVPDLETKERLIAQMKSKPMPDFNIEE